MFAGIISSSKRAIVQNSRALRENLLLGVILQGYLRVLDSGETNKVVFYVAFTYLADNFVQSDAGEAESTSKHTAVKDATRHGYNINCFNQF